MVGIDESCRCYWSDMLWKQRRCRPITLRYEKTRVEKEIVFILYVLKPPAYTEYIDEGRTYFYLTTNEIFPPSVHLLPTKTRWELSPKIRRVSFIPLVLTFLRHPQSNWFPDWRPFSIFVQFFFNLNLNRYQPISGTVLMMKIKSY